LVPRTRAMLAARVLWVLAEVAVVLELLVMRLS
jgi:hypothetical protein